MTERCPYPECVRCCPDHACAKVLREIIEAWNAAGSHMNARQFQGVLDGAQENSRSSKAK